VTVKEEDAEKEPTVFAREDPETEGEDEETEGGENGGGHTEKDMGVGGVR